MSEDKPLGEKEKLEAEISRSLSVAKMKEAHKQIEEIEKSRKRSVILSIIERLNISILIFGGMIRELDILGKKIPEYLLNKRLPEDRPKDIPEINYIVKTYDSIYFDFQKNIDIKQEDFDRLFPKVIMYFDTLTNITTTLVSILTQMMNMKAYCLRLL